MVQPVANATTTIIEGLNECGKADRPQPCDQEPFGFLKRIAQGFVDDAGDLAPRLGMLDSDCKQARAANGTMHVQEGHCIQIGRDGPTTAVSLF
ncbi:hypothetical protein ASE72_18035 [Sphingomonas sp. Leaf20]|nr:hypothetical protein ASE72_18035 [Sphingomonas sp. Leaf20]